MSTALQQPVQHTSVLHSSDQHSSDQHSSVQHPSAQNLALPSRPDPGIWSTVEDHRLEVMALAVELGVDRDDFVFRSAIELAIWVELEIEFEARIANEGPTWVADEL